MNEARRPSTREALISAAAEEFSRSGYDGVSVRDVERRAGVTRGLAAHHFGSKEAMWEACIEWLVGQFKAEIDRYGELMDLIPVAERGAILVKVYARFAAKHPEFFRIVLFEGVGRSPRSVRVIEQFLRPLRDFLDPGPREDDTPQQAAARKFILFGAASTIFAMPASVEDVFGFSPFEDGFAEMFADALGKVEAALAPGAEIVTAPSVGSARP